MTTVDPLPFKIPIKDIPSEHKEKCPTCGGLCVKAGKRYTNSGVVQRFCCKTCGTSHSTGTGHYPRVIKEYAKDLYKSGLSLREVAKKIEENLSVVLTHQAVLRWLEKADIPRRKPKPRTQKEKRKIYKVFSSPLQLLINIQIRFNPTHDDSTPFIVTEFIDIINICDPWEEV